MPGNERELKLKLTIEADVSKGSRAMQDLATQAQRASLAVQDAQRHMQRMGGGAGAAGMPGGGYAARPAWPGYGGGGYGGGYHAPQPFYGYGPPQPPMGGPIIAPGGVAAAAVGGGGGWAAGIGKTAGRAAGVLALVDTAANLTESFQQLDNQFLTARDKLLSVYRSVPLIGNAFAGIVDGVISAVERIKDPATAKKLDALRFTSPIQQHFEKANAARSISSMSLIREQRSAEFGLQALREFPLEAIRTDPNLSPLENRNAMSMAEARNSLATGGRSMRQAEMEADFSRGEVNRQREVYAMADERRLAAKAAFDAADHAAKNPKPGAGFMETFGGKAALELKRLQYQEAANTQQAELAKLEASMTANKEKQLSFVQKEHEFRKLQTGEMKTQLAILHEEAARSRQQAQSFGAMDTAGQRGLINAAERFKQGGRDYVTAQELSGLQQFAPEVIGKDLEKAGQANPLLAELQKVLGIRDSETINREIGKLEARIAMHVKFDEEETAKSLKQALDKLNLQDLLGRIVGDKFKLEVEAFRIQQGAGRATNN